VGGVAVRAGRPGAGKTRLLEAAVEAARERRAIVLSAHGSEPEYELAFGGVRQLFARAVGPMGAGARAPARGGPADAAGSILGVSDQGLVAGEPLFALASLVSNLSDLDP